MEASNVKAMREAVVALLDALDSLGCTEETAVISMMVPDMAESGKKCLGAILKAKAALSAPPRNCDRFASAEEAWDAYDEWADSYRTQGKTEPFNEVGWLFASAKEGGNDGSK